MTSLLNKCFIPLRFSTPQLKIGMCGTNGIAGPHEKVKHHDRVQSATDGQQDPIAWFGQPMPGNIMLEGFEHNSKLSIIRRLTGFSNFADS